MAFWASVDVFAWCDNHPHKLITRTQSEGTNHNINNLAASKTHLSRHGSRIRLLLELVSGCQQEAGGPAGLEDDSRPPLNTCCGTVEVSVAAMNWQHPLGVKWEPQHIIHPLRFHICSSHKPVQEQNTVTVRRCYCYPFISPTNSSLSLQYSHDGPCVRIWGEELGIISIQSGMLINTKVINSCKQEVLHTYPLKCVLIMEVNLPGECNESLLGSG